MTVSESGGVRPTKKCLSEIGMAFPVVNQPLLPISHPLIEKAQRLPAEAEAGGAEPILALNDRAWFKVKIAVHRGAATKLKPEDTEDPKLLQQENAWWWICAAGERKADSKSDFYKAIEAEASRAHKKIAAETGGGADAKKVSTQHLLPQEIDYKRLRGEIAFQVSDGIRRLTRRLIYMSLTSGNIVTAELTGHLLKACVRAADQEAYLAIVAEGFIDPNILAVVLDSVPDVSAEDWQVEPGGAMGVTPAYGQIVYSTVIPPSSQAKIIALFGDEES
ncbi:hypothetical protein GCM10029976_076930 [Kribbella albertanoniae]|uniref:Uncharacterized protein n=1 Tax=Kribbella albertanoniae TaxID=1266829 RepID=A0A4R4Q4R0_9ACTN|nr:hypothetical protein [Kribbella albertanoniae]TDC30030.1 hypothetical protein E1261_14335 [Kribbella albertanoniae]